MASFNDVLTREGRELINRMLAGEIQIQFTKMVWGDGTVPSGQALIDMTDLISPKAEGAISVGQNNNIVTVTGVFQNKDLSTGMYLREKGVYASDGNSDEILMIYANCGSEAEYIEPAIEGIVQKVMKSVMTFSQNDNVSIAISSEAYVLRVDYDEDMERVAFFGNGDEAEIPEDTDYITESKVVKTYGELMQVTDETLVAGAKAVKEAIEAGGGGGGGGGGTTDVASSTVLFTQASTRSNIASGESVATLFGKVKKYFADLKTVAFTGSYNDLLNKPSLFSGSYDDLSDKPSLFSGSYNDLTNKPTIPTLESVSDAWNNTTTYSVGQYCIYNNSLYKCLVQNSGTVPTNTTYWFNTNIGSELSSAGGDFSSINVMLDPVSGSATIQSGENTSIVSFVLEAGTYILNKKVAFADVSLKAGERRSNVYGSNDMSVADSATPPCPAANTLHECSDIFTISAATAFYVYVVQTSGSNMTVNAYVKAIKLK